MYDLRPFIRRVRYRLEQFRDSEDMYDLSNVVNILYSIGDLPELSERGKLADRLKRFQSMETGLFVCEGHFETHSTAFVSGALDLLDEKPPHRAYELEKYLDKEELFGFMESLDWNYNPWLSAHLGAGIYASMVLTGTSNDVWEDYYFEWLDNNQNPDTGLWKKGITHGAPVFHYLAAAFHYVFNYNYAKRRIPYSAELLKTCIEAYDNGECMNFSNEMGWADIDYTYMLVHLFRECKQYGDDCDRILKEIADGLAVQLLELEEWDNSPLESINTLFAIVCSLAVLQDALPGLLRTSVPLKLVLDKRPFL